jgi:hypothetical protein
VTPEVWQLRTYPLQPDKQGQEKILPLPPEFRARRSEKDLCRLDETSRLSLKSKLCSVMFRVRHCVECPKCRTRYVPGFSPYCNGSYLIPLAANALSEWILYCTCGSPNVCSRWSGMELKAYQVPDEYYLRGYGSPDEILSINPKWHDS